MAAQGQQSVTASVEKPGGVRLMKSRWLIQQTLLAGRPRKSGCALTVSSVFPYSPAWAAGLTSPPAIQARSWSP